MSGTPRLTLGLRSRVSLAFGMGSLTVSLLLAVTTYGIARGYLLEQRLQSATRQAVLNARVLDAALLTGRPATDDLLARLDATSGTASHMAAVTSSRWHDGGLPGGHRSLPAPFRSAVAEGRAVTQRFQYDGDLKLAVAIPLEMSGSAYVEVFDLIDLDRTLTALTVIFAGTATATTALGLLLGRWASRRALRPLHTVASAAGAVARGDLATRLDVAGDPDLQELAAAFNDTTERLQQRVARDARFAGNVSHELRSPLTTIVNAVELLEDRAEELSPETRELLSLLAVEVRRLATMVHDLLEISRPDSGSALHLEPITPATLVPMVADRTAGGTVTVVEPACERLLCLGDKRRLEQVVANLVRNAVQHAGGVALVRVECGRGVVRIAVEDHGPGVPAALRDQVFEPFTRGDQRGGRAAEGVGLGLALVRQHVTALHGRVWVEDRPGGGARFVVELPTAPPP